MPLRRDEYSDVHGEQPCVNLISDLSKVGTSRQEVGTGDILIGHRILITSFLLDKKILLDEGHLFNFCTLINAIAFTNRSVTLPAQLPDEMLRSPLYEYLVKKRILYKFDSFIEADTKRNIEISKETRKTRSLHYSMKWDNSTNDYYEGSLNVTGDMNSPRAKVIQEVIRVKN